MKLIIIPLIALLAFVGNIKASQKPPCQYPIESLEVFCTQTRSTAAIDNKIVFSPTTYVWTFINEQRCWMSKSLYATHSRISGAHGNKQLEKLVREALRQTIEKFEYDRDKIKNLMHKGKK